MIGETMTICGAKRWRNAHSLSLILLHVLIPLVAAQVCSDATILEQRLRPVGLQLNVPFVMTWDVYELSDGLTGLCGDEQYWPDSNESKVDTLYDELVDLRSATFTWNEDFDTTGNNPIVAEMWVDISGASISSQRFYFDIWFETNKKLNAIFFSGLSTSTTNAYQIGDPEVVLQLPTVGQIPDNGLPLWETVTFGTGCAGFEVEDSTIDPLFSVDYIARTLTLLTVTDITYADMCLYAQFIASNDVPAFGTITQQSVTHYFTLTFCELTGWTSTDSELMDVIIDYDIYSGPASYTLGAISTQIPSCGYTDLAYEYYEYTPVAGIALDSSTSPPTLAIDVNDIALTGSYYARWTIVVNNLINHPSLPTYQIRINLLSTLCQQHTCTLGSVSPVLLAFEVEQSITSHACIDSVSLSTGIADACGPIRYTMVFASSEDTFITAATQQVGSVFYLTYTKTYGAWRPTGSVTVTLVVESDYNASLDSVSVVLNVVCVVTDISDSNKVSGTIVHTMHTQPQFVPYFQLVQTPNCENPVATLVEEYDGLFFSNWVTPGLWLTADVIENNVEGFRIYSTNLSDEGTHYMRVTRQLADASYGTTNTKDDTFSISIEFCEYNTFSLGGLFDSQDTVITHTLHPNATEYALGSALTLDTACVYTLAHIEIESRSSTDTSTLGISINAGNDGIVVHQHDRSLAGTYDLRWRVVVNEWPDHPEVWKQFSVTLVDPCLTTSIVLQSIQPIVLVLGESSEYVVPEHVDNVADDYQITDYCGVVSAILVDLPEEYMRSLLYFEALSTYLFEFLDYFPDELDSQAMLEVYLDDVLMHTEPLTYLLQKCQIEYIQLLSSPSQRGSPDLVYKLGSGEIQFEMPLYEVEPETCDYANSTFTSDWPGTYDPEWLVSFDVPCWHDAARTCFSVSATERATIGIWRIEITESVTDQAFGYPYSDTVAIDLQIEKSEPDPPIFVDSNPVLGDFELELADELSYSFPEFTDDGDLTQVTISLSCKALENKLALVGPSEQPTGFTLSGLTEEDAGMHVITVTLTDDEGATTNYGIAITVVAPPSELLEELLSSILDNQGNETAEAETTFDWQSLLPQQRDISMIENPVFPDVYIVRISKSGLVTLRFTKEMKAPPLNAIQSAIALRDGQKLPAVQLTIDPGLDSLPEKLRFTYNITKYEGRTLELQMNFEDAKYVSAFEYPDTLVIRFPGNLYFFDTEGLWLPEGKRLERALISQLQQGQATESLKDSVKGLKVGSDGVMTLNFLVNLVLSASLNQLWSMINTQQIVVLFPLFSLRLPANAALFYGFIMQIAAFDIFDTDLMYTAMFPNMVPTPPLGPNFEAIGYESSNSLLNFGSLIFVVLFQIMMTFLYLLTVCIRSFRVVDAVRQRVSAFMFYNGYITFLLESFMIIAMCGYINLLALSFADFGSALNSFFGICSLLIVHTAPIILYVKLRTNFAQLDTEAMRNMYGAYYSQLDLRVGKQALLQPSSFFLRRALLASLVVFQSFLFVQVFSLIMLVVFQVILLGYVKPFLTKASQRQEMMNEVFIMFIFYSFVSLSDLVQDVETRYTVGFASCGLVSIHLAVNVAIIFVQASRDTVQKIKKLRNKVRFNKVLARIEKRREEQRRKEQEEEAAKYISSGELEIMQQENMQQLRANLTQVRQIGKTRKDRLKDKIQQQLERIEQQSDQSSDFDVHREVQRVEDNHYLNNIRLWGRPEQARDPLGVTKHEFEVASDSEWSPKPGKRHDAHNRKLGQTDDLFL